MGGWSTKIGNATKRAVRKKRPNYSSSLYLRRRCMKEAHQVVLGFVCPISPQYGFHHCRAAASGDQDECHQGRSLCDTRSHYQARAGWNLGCYMGGQLHSLRAIRATLLSSSWLHISTQRGSDRRVQGTILEPTPERSVQPLVLCIRHTHGTKGWQRPVGCLREQSVCCWCAQVDCTMVARGRMSKLLRVDPKSSLQATS